MRGQLWIVRFSDLKRDPSCMQNLIGQLGRFGLPAVISETYSDITAVESSTTHALYSQYLPSVCPDTSMPPNLQCLPWGRRSLHRKVKQNRYSFIHSTFARLPKFHLSSILPLFFSVDSTFRRPDKPLQLNTSESIGCEMKNLHSSELPVCPTLIHGHCFLLHRGQNCRLAKANTCSTFSIGTILLTQHWEFDVPLQPWIPRTRCYLQINSLGVHRYV